MKWLVKDTDLGNCNVFSESKLQMFVIHSSFFLELKQVRFLLDNLEFLQKLESREDWLAMHALCACLGCFLLLIVLLCSFSNMHATLQIK